MEGNQGIKESKEALEFVAELINSFDKAIADGKFSVMDALNFLPALVSAPNALGNLSALQAEIKDYSTEEIKELSNAFKAKLKISNVKLEEGIEGGLEIALNVARLLSVVKV